MMSALELKRFRELIGWNQSQVAKTLGVTQSALSMIERGRIPVSQAHIDRLIAGTASTNPTFKQFLATLKAEHAKSSAALSTLQSRHSILPVWEWHEGFDLARAPSPAQAVELVMVRTTERACIALAMEKKTNYWQAGETIVFEECGPEELKTDNLCLIQFRQSGARASRAFLAVARIIRASKSRQLDFLPLSPGGIAIERAGPRISACLRASYRAKYV